MIVATVRSVNGFIIEANGEEYFIKSFDIKTLLNAKDHEAELKSLILSFPADGGKIAPIRAAREYIRANGDFRSWQLRDVKEYVESLREWTYIPSYR